MRNRWSPQIPASCNHRHMSNNGQEVDWQPRRARLDEAPVVADLWLLSRRASIPQIPPPTHSKVEVRAWFKEVVFPSKDAWVIEAPDQLAALMVIGDVWIEQLYVHPAWNGRGLGSQLLELAKRERPRLDLWTFQSNGGARRFYERHGFVAVNATDGDNEEGEPDVRYHWEQRDYHVESLSLLLPPCHHS